MGDNSTHAFSKSLLREDLRGHVPAYNLEFNEKIRAMRSRGEDVYHFGFGQSPFKPMKEMVNSLKDHAEENAYLNVAGIPELRTAIVQFHSKYDNMQFNKDSVLVGPGSKELIFLLFSVFGGDILVSNPTWPTYKPQARLAGRDAYVIETSFSHEWRVTPQAIEKTITANGLGEGPKLFIFCNPDNPTGTAYEEQHLKELTETFRKHNIIVISDEIYGRLHYNSSHHTLSRYYPEGTILSSGFSKWASAGGWRVGYQIYPPFLYELRDAVRSAGSQTYSCAPAPMQYAIADTLMDEKACEDYIKHSTRIMEAVGKYCHRELTDVGVKCVEPKAGYYCFPDFEVCRKALAKRGIMTGVQMCDAMLKECKVALMAGGPAFLRPIEEFTVRFCFVNFCGDTALAESTRIGLNNPLPPKFVQNHANQVYLGIQALKSWVLQHVDA